MADVHLRSGSTVDDGARSTHRAGRRSGALGRPPSLYGRTVRRQAYACYTGAMRGGQQAESVRAGVKPVIGNAAVRHMAAHRTGRPAGPSPGASPDHRSTLVVLGIALA